MNPATPQNPPPLAEQNGAPDSFECSLKLAFEMHNAGRCEEAEALCRVLEQIRPRNGQLLFLLGMILHKTSQDEEAVQWLSRAAEYRPGSARIFNGLGCAYQGLEDHARAAAAFEKALELQPESADVFYNLGKSRYLLGQVDHATELFRRAVEINPRDANSWNNLGKCLKELNHLRESIAAYNRAVEIMPDYALAHYGRAISLMTDGRLLEGFREYEWRWHSMTPRKFPQPVWHGESAPRKTLFVHAEQGFGDAIQMARFMSMARERVGSLILECRPELTTLLQYSKCADVVIPHGAAIPSFDYFVPLMSLPRALGVTMETIPARTPYLRAPAHEGLPSQAGCLKVGLAWAGNPNHHQDAARSIPLEALAPILGVPGVAFYSLLPSAPQRDQSSLQSSRVIHSDLVFKDFLDTASVIAEMDLVIAVDTAVAHLAGALAKPTWLLVQHSPDWRWFLDRADTPWYPTMQLFRQTERGRWETPIRRVAGSLRRLASSTAAPIEILRGLQPASPVHRLAAA